MSFEEIKNLLQNGLGNEAIDGEETSGLQPALIIRKESIVAVCRFLRDTPSLHFDFLSLISGVDYGPDDARFAVVYHLASIPYKIQLTLKVYLPHADRSEDDLPALPSVTSIYRTADWHERETYDLCGIFFENHPDLRRILLPDDWEGHPLRKDYKTADEYRGIKIDF